MSDEDKARLQDILLLYFESIPNLPNHCIILNFDSWIVAGVERISDNQIQRYPRLIYEESEKLAAPSAWLIGIGDRVTKQIHAKDYIRGILNSEQGIIYQEIIKEHELCVLINWENGLTMQDFVDSWDDLQKAIETLRKKLEK